MTEINPNVLVEKQTQSKEPTTLVTAKGLTVTKVTTTLNTQDGATFEMYKWIKACRSFHLTLGDVLKLKKGEKLDVCMLDRNFE